MIQSRNFHSWIGSIHAEIIDEPASILKESPTQEPVRTGKSQETETLSNGNSFKNQIYNHSNLKATEELRLIVEKNDKTEWTETALNTARKTLAQRIESTNLALQKFRSDNAAEHEAARQELERRGEVETF